MHGETSTVQQQTTVRPLQRLHTRRQKHNLREANRASKFHMNTLSIAPPAGASTITKTTAASPETARNRRGASHVTLPAPVTPPLTGRPPG